MRASLRALSRPLATPLHTAAGRLDRRELLVLTLRDSHGNVGHGEAAPLRAPVERVAAALRDCLPVLRSDPGENLDELRARCASAAMPPEALAAVDLALWDLAGRRAGQPVWRLLGAAGAGQPQVNATIGSADRAAAEAEAAAARAAGFRAVKVKVALGDDHGRLASVRAAAGPETAIRLDANGGWSVEEARAALRGLAPMGIELCEEPVHGADAIAELASDCPVGISIDETAGQPGALERRICQAVCLKVGPSGGITGLLAAWRAARAVGYEVYLASSLDGPLGIAAALHAAAVIRPARACGLATLPLYAGGGPLEPRAGRMTPPEGAGLGDGLIEWY